MKRLLRIAIAWVALLGMALSAHAQSLDESWTLTVNGQTVVANPDGSFLIPNISAADSFGPAGPGSRPDFLSDDFYGTLLTSEDLF